MQWKMENKLHWYTPSWFLKEPLHKKDNILCLWTNALYEGANLKRQRTMPNEFDRSFCSFRVLVEPSWTILK